MQFFQIGAFLQLSQDQYHLSVFQVTCQKDYHHDVYSNYIMLFGAIHKYHKCIIVNDVMTCNISNKIFLLTISMTPQWPLFAGLKASTSVVQDRCRRQGPGGTGAWQQLEPLRDSFFERNRVWSQKPRKDPRTNSCFEFFYVFLFLYPLIWTCVQKVERALRAAPNDGVGKAGTVVPWSMKPSEVLKPLLNHVKSYQIHFWCQLCWQNMSLVLCPTFGSKHSDWWSLESKSDFYYSSDNQERQSL